MKNYLKFLMFTLCLSGGFLGIGFFNKATAVESPKAGQYDCSATINFGISPSVITATQSVNISGYVKANKVVPPGTTYEGYCMYPGADYPPISEYIVSIYDKTSSRELFYLTGFKLEYKSGKSSYQWALPSRSIGSTELRQSGIRSAKNLNLVAQVKFKDRNGNWYKLTESAPPIAIAVTLPADSSSDIPPAGVKTPPADGQTPPADSQTPPAGGMKTQPAQTLYNPIKDASNLTELLLKIMRGFIMITGIWAVAFIVIGGFKMVISQGNEEAVTAAKKSIMWSVLGLIVVLLAFSIIAIIQNIIGIDVQDVKTSQNQIYQRTQKL